MEIMKCSTNYEYGYFFRSVSATVLYISVCFGSGHPKARLMLMDVVVVGALVDGKIST